MARRLTRDTQHAVLAGVAAGFADYLNVDPVLVRIGFLLLLFFSGLGLPLYILCWVVMPRRDRVAGEGAAAAPAPADRIAEDVREAGEKAVEGLRDSLKDRGGSRLVAGTILIILGLLFLLDRFSWFHWWDWVRLANLWPLVLVGVGVAMILGARRPRAGGAPPSSDMT